MKRPCVIPFSDQQKSAIMFTSTFMVMFFHLLYVLVKSSTLLFANTTMIFRENFCKNPNISAEALGRPKSVTISLNSLCVNCSGCSKSSSWISKSLPLSWELVSESDYSFPNVSDGEGRGRPGPCGMGHFADNRF